MIHVRLILIVAYFFLEYVQQLFFSAPPPRLYLLKHFQHPLTWWQESKYLFFLIVDQSQLPLFFPKEILVYEIKNK